MKKRIESTSNVMLKMGKEYNGSPKPHQLESKRKRLTWILGVGGLCVLVQLLRLPDLKSTTESSVVTEMGKPASASDSPLDFERHHELVVNSSGGTIEQFPPCDMSFSEYTPCQDPQRGRKFDRSMLKYRERTLPYKGRAPPAPFKWPQSRDYAWYDNIPHKELSIEKAIQNWIQVEGDRFRFPGGGTMFPRGADAYIDDIAQLIPLNSGKIRTAIDTGCGVASWGAYLLKRNIIAMSFAPRDTHEAQVWFALERGVPAMIGIMASQRLPYPARAFDMAHCSRCLIPWNKNDGMYLIEVDRVLRPGGYWILSGPPIRWKKYWKGWERTEEDLKQEQDSIEDVAKRLCWKKVRGLHDIAGGALEKWPQRAFAIPPRISTSGSGITVEKFHEDNEVWKERVAHYKRIIGALPQGRYRNVMDMNAYLGGFAAALTKYPVWITTLLDSSMNGVSLGPIMIGARHFQPIHEHMILSMQLVSSVFTRIGVTLRIFC
ncbi:hypothetical protein HYC85_004210 [Camellia sinensis]|uniref:Methyltransferase n=1 Tax=Camellia sinensis TaxID=4442 RepID=A0A7J7HWV2_CAMSI|nr:hypothetical protein HYC85_004210 [Camellia sinensis]